ncbi:hypothetical protein HED60_08905 [Planctomycetales bacterium ZRK34]|nr:hypothetical protein HED60_08905 [Planctomycetales bacterium ZRK34]
MRQIRRHGFVLIDAIAAVTIVAALGVSMLYALHGYRGAMATLNDAKQAITLAEAALVKLQTGDGLPLSDADTTYDIEPINEGHLLPGRRWVRLRITHRGHEAELIGVVPIVSTPGGGR